MGCRYDVYYDFRILTKNHTDAITEIHKSKPTAYNIKISANFSRFGGLFTKCLRWHLLVIPVT